MPLVRQKWLSQVSFGLAALSLTRLTSLNANARVASANRNTGEVKMRRLMGNRELSATLCQMARRLTPISEHSFLNVDYSDFSGLTALVAAVQTRMGRALPIFVSTTYSGKLSVRDDASKRTQFLRKAYKALNQKLTNHTVAGLKQMRQQLGFWPRLVFDRGFGSEDIVKLLVREEATFYIRMKAGRLAGIGGNKVILENLPTRDEIITLYGLRLRVVVSRRVGKHKEPWYILTSDLTSSAKRIIRIYYYRFEIEETFRDIKSILGMRRTKLLKPLSLEILLWFVSLGILLLYLAGMEVVGKQRLLGLLAASSAKKRLSWYRTLWELLEQAVRQPLYSLITGKA